MSAGIGRIRKGMEVHSSDGECPGRGSASSGTRRGMRGAQGEVGAAMVGKLIGVALAMAMLGALMSACGGGEQAGQPGAGETRAPAAGTPTGGAPVTGSTPTGEAPSVEEVVTLQAELTPLPTEAQPRGMDDAGATETANPLPDEIEGQRATEPAGGNP